MKDIIVKSIKAYQAVFSPLLGKNCRFYPSCSEYTCSCVEKYGSLAGILKGAKRILKCHPLNAGGVDLP
ncbi:MAG: membrane protein insertion efficiency factor YidD [Candidatus Nealsonbacteria bacterium]|nr:membrane protein insertion efficiency factor YidD [Candidatus Nealsonbacteria bacterium]